jgi:hypothetical protein
MDEKRAKEFGHIAASGSFEGQPLFIDGWGAGPFVIVVDERSFRFEDSDRFGPSLITRRGDVCVKPWPPEGSPFWHAYQAWRSQGRNVEADGKTCIWREPKPLVIQHIGGRHYKVIEHGEEGGRTIKMPRVRKSTQ